MSTECNEPRIAGAGSAPLPVESDLRADNPESGRVALVSKAVPIGASAIALAACGGGEGNSGSPATNSGAPPISAARKPQSEAEAARFLLQASFAADAGAISALRSEGFEPWLDRQMRQPNDVSAKAYFEGRGFDTVDANRFYNGTTTGDWMIWSQLLSGGNSLRKRFALALSEFFVVSLSDIDISWRGPAIGEYWDILNRNAFGSFRTLIEEISLNPAMGVFLNTRGNRRADPRTGRVPDENYGRELMQLFSIGLFELNPDGTPRTGGGQLIETYTNDDVTGIAEVFTGYDFDYSQTTSFPDPGNPGRTVAGVDFARRPMTADPSKWSRPRTEGFHSLEEKRFLGLVIPAGTNAPDSLRLALDHLVLHPNVGPFFARQMIQRLVTSNPSPGYVGRVAAVFANNVQGQRGDLGAMFKAILLDEEALSSANVNNPASGKLREPMLRFIQLARTFGVRSASGNFEVGSLSDPANRLGQSPLRSPSVFNFFRPGYFPTGSQTAANNLLAPEFQLVNETSVAGYVNFLERAVDMSAGFLRDLSLSYSAELPLAHDAVRLVDHLDLVLTAKQLSPSVAEAITAALGSIAVQESSAEPEKLRRIHAAVMLVMASTDYLVQK
ncbi:DUF1800 domain-containing protein [Erythrobacter sp. NFXS35]|uniref:DUF1800 domain-containing protein n=1 Tax=Erythrobacter sp. NFXS35 TaxID=2818436 RepID=UPI0032DE2DC4